MQGSGCWVYRNLLYYLHNFSVKLQLFQKSSLFEKIKQIPGLSLWSLRHPSGGHQTPLAKKNYKKHLPSDQIWLGNYFPGNHPAKKKKVSRL